MIPLVSYILKTGFISYALSSNLEVSGLADRLTVQTYQVDDNACAVVFAVRNADDLSSHLVIYPREKPASGSVYNGNFYEELDGGKRVTTSVWDDYYLTQTARLNDSERPGYSVPSATILDKQRDFDLKVSVWAGGESGIIIRRSVSCDPNACICQEIL